jgi:hypothetical protein
LALADAHDAELEGRTVAVVLATVLYAFATLTVVIGRAPDVLTGIDEDALAADAMVEMSWTIVVAPAAGSVYAAAVDAGELIRAVPVVVAFRWLHAMTLVVALQSERTNTAALPANRIGPALATGAVGNTAAGDRELDVVGLDLQVSPVLVYLNVVRTASQVGYHQTGEQSASPVVVEADLDPK